MSGGALTKEAKEMFLKEDIEHHRQRTLNNKNFIPKDKILSKLEDDEVRE